MEWGNLVFLPEISHVPETVNPLEMTITYKKKKEKEEYLKYLETNLASMNEKKFDVNIIFNNKTLLEIAMKYGNYSHFDRLMELHPIIHIEFQNVSSPLFLSIKLQDKYYLKAFLKTGINPNQYLNDTTLLSYACELNRYNHVKKLVKYGADVNLKDPDAYLGYSPLHTAVEFEAEEIVKFLLKNGADPNSLTNTSEPPLFLISLDPFAKSIFNLLIKYGADINYISNNETNLFVYAVKYGIIEAAENFFNAGADFTVPNIKGRTALHYAYKYNYINIIKLITERMLSDLSIEDNSFFHSPKRQRTQ